MAASTTQKSSSAGSETVHQHLQSLCTRLCDKVQENAEGKVASLQRQFEQESVRVLQALRDRGNTLATAAGKAVKRLEVSIQCIEGPHKGLAFTIKPHARRLVPKVGRSTGKQFLKNGISLPDDGEVSTVHGRFDVCSGQLQFTDIGSTNGTVMKGDVLVPGEAVTLEAGSELLVGQCRLKVVSISLA